jgi:hypothetical protein
VDGIVFENISSFRNEREYPVEYQCLDVSVAYVFFLVAQFLEVLKAGFDVFL